MEIEIGGFYKLRNGCKCLITSHLEGRKLNGDGWQFEGKIVLNNIINEYSNYWTKEGKFYQGGTDDEFDIISKLEESPTEDKSVEVEL